MHQAAQHSNLLTDAEFAQLERREILRYGCHSTPWRDNVIEIEWLLLAALAEAAATGERLYEFMSLSRPGDLLRYARVHLVDVGDRTLALIQSRRRSLRDYDVVRNGDCLSFLDFEWSHWVSGSAWQYWGSDLAIQHWNHLRTRSFWREHLGGLWQLVRLLQARIRGMNADVLLQHEIGLMDQGEHRRDYWSKREQLPNPFPCSRLRTNFVPPGLAELLCALARHPGIRSMSLPFTDYYLWRDLIKEQVLRSLAEGVPPNDALYLGGAEADAWAEEAADWGGEIKGPRNLDPYDVFVLPDWHAWSREQAVATGSARAGSGCFGPPKCSKVFIVKHDLGEFETETRISCDGWFVYRAKDFK